LSAIISQYCIRLPDFDYWVNFPSSRSRLLFLAEFLKARIVAQWIPHWIDAKKATRDPKRHFEQMRKSGEGGIQVAKTGLNLCQHRFGGWLAFGVIPEIRDCTHGR
jgi:hypothetical protein